MTKKEIYLYQICRHRHRLVRMRPYLFLLFNPLRSFTYKMQGYNLTHTSYTIRWHYRRRILHSTVQGINKDTPPRQLQIMIKPFTPAPSTAEPLTLFFSEKDTLIHSLNHPRPIEDQLAGVLNREG